MRDFTTGQDNSTPSTLHAARLEAGAACLDAALSLYLPRGLAPTCCCDPEHISVGKKHARECTGRSWGKTPLHKWKHFQTTRPTAAEVQALWTSYPIGNVGCVLGQASGLVRIDVDGEGGEALLQEWSGGDLPPTWTFRSSAQGRGLLYAWPKEMPCKSTTKAEPGEHRELRLQANGAQTILPPSRHASGWRYTWDPGCSPTECELSPAPAWLRARLQVTPRATASPPQLGKAEGAPLQAAVGQATYAIGNSGDGVDYDTWLKVGMALHSLETAWAWELWDGWSQQSTKYSQGKQEASWRSFDPSGTVQIDWLFALARSHGWRETPHHSLVAPEETSRLSSLSSLSSLPSQRTFPDIAPAAFQGLSRDLRDLLAPHTEASDVALLIQFLTYFGVLIHRQAYYTVEATNHYTNLYACLIGATSRARKGTSYDRIDSLMRTVDTSWALSNVAGGCGSGEGLIAAVRDPVVKREPIKERGRLVGYQEVEVDPGVIDKRLLVQEPEFAAVLKIASREGNTLSMIMRQAWDSGNLRNTVKSSPLMATGAHIAIVGHITEEELCRYLSTTEMANGFANRFLWICVKRSKLLPDGGTLFQEDFAPLLKRLHAARDKAVQIAQMRRHPEARAVWHAVYPALTADRPGLLGAMIARAEAQVLRLSCLYALLDGTAVITAEHLCAALALWQYVEASVSYVFGDATGDPTIDVLRTALREQYPQGLTKWQITTEVFANHRRAEEINRALLSLRETGRITVQEDHATGGRPSQTFFYRPECEESEESEESPHTYLAQAREALEHHRGQAREAFEEGII